jgi:MraZ protein
MLTGEYRHTIDSKNRLFIPAKHREELGTSFMIVKDLRGPRLKVISKQAWETYTEPIRQQERKSTEQPVIEQKVAEKLRRFLYATAIEAEPDSQGRVILTPALMEYAGISKETVIVGCADYAEIWAADKYDAEMNDLNLDDLREALEAIGL